MASQDYTIELLLKANNQLSGELTKIQGQIDKLDKQVNQTSESVNTAFSKIGSIIKQGAIVGAIYKIGQSIRDLTSAFEPVENSFYRLSETAGIVGEDMLQAMRNASLGTVSDFDLMSAANKAYSLGVVSSIDDMTTLMEIARLKGQAMGRTMEEALGDIMTGLGRASPLILDNLGIVVKQGEAQEKYAEEIGKTVSQLTEEEKKQALVNAVVEQGKKELEAAGEVPMTMQERFAQLQAQIQNMAVVIGQQVAPAINDFFEQLGTDLKTTQSDIVDKITGVLRAFINGVRTIYNVIISIAKVVQGGVFGILNGILSKTSEIINGVIDKINQFTEKINSKLGTSIGKIGQVTIGGVVGASEDYFQIWKDTINNVKEDWIDFGADIITQQNKIDKSVKNTTKTIGDLTSAMNGTTSGKGGTSSKTSEALKQIQNTYKSITQSIEDQEKVIKQTNQEWQKGYDELESQFKEVDKNVQDLTKSVGDLKKQLSDLSKDETSDIAAEFVNARRELQKMERDYEGIGEVAKQYSMDYLENFTHGGIGKYDIDALIQYKKYSDEMASVYDGLNESERQAMDEQIAYQEWYQSLNGIEKIREDYRIKREEIQGELNEKLSALHQEEIKRAEIDKQMKQYQKEWLAAIDVEIKKRIAMYTEKMEYEKQYQQQLEIDYQKQMDMYNALIRKARELAQVRASTGGPSGSRATGGPVYAGQSYLVGENGPELFIPSQNGSITKNEDLNKGQEFTINVNMGGVVVNDNQDTEELAETIANTITRQLELYKKGIY